MIIHSSKYLLSAALESQWPNTEVPEICLAGRSNVGKSSFINTMLNRHGLAKTSGKPGKTRTLNFYDVNNALHFVDVPGYGYAMINASLKASFGSMIEAYLEKRTQLKAMILIVDLRHKPTKDDVMMYQFIKNYHIPAIIVATKVDKLKKNDIQKHLELVKETLNVSAYDKVILFSSLKRIGVEEVWHTLTQLLGKDA